MHFRIKYEDPIIPWSDEGKKSIIIDLYVDSKMQLNPSLFAYILSDIQ